MLKIIISEKAPKNEIWILNYDRWENVIKTHKIVNIEMPENDQPLNPNNPDEEEED